MIKQQIKSLFKPMYRKVIAKLRNSLHLDEHSRLLNHIVEQNIHLKQDITTLQHEINVLTLLIGGIESQKGNDAFTLTPEDTTRDIINMLVSSQQSEASTVALLNKLPQNTFKEKSICLIGAGTAFFKKELENRGAKQITRIEINPLLMKTDSATQQSNTTYVYPSQIGTVHIPIVDILFIAHPAAAAYLLKRKLLHIAAQVKETGLFILSGDEQERKYLATVITGSGFTQVAAVPDGTTISFDYLELRKPPKHTRHQNHETALYQATKLPIIS